MSKEYKLDKLDNETRLELIAKHKAAGLRRREDERLESADPANKGWPIHIDPYDDEFSDEEYAILTSRDVERSAILRSHNAAAEKRSEDENYLRSLPIPKLGATESLPLYPGELDPLALRDVWKEVGKIAKAEQDAQWVDTGSAPELTTEERKRIVKGGQSDRLKEIKAKLRATPYPQGVTEEWVSTIDEIGEKVAA